MNHLIYTALLTRDTLMFLPLIIFCFLPVMPYVKDSVKRLVMKIISAVVAVEAAIFLIYYFLPTDIASFLNSFGCMAIFYWLYRNEVTLNSYRLWFVFITACLLGSFGYLIYHVADIFLNPSGTIDEAPSLLAFAFELLFECLLILILHKPIQKYLGWLITQFHEERIWKTIWIFPAIFVFVFYFFIPYDNSLMYQGRILQLYLTTIVAFLLTAILIYTLFYKIAYAMNENRIIMERSIYLEMEAEQYRNMQEYVQNTSRLRHDFRHHITALSAMLEKREYEEAKAFLKDYHQDVSRNARQYCDSAAVNAVLNHYMSCCLEERIPAHFSIRIGSKHTMKDTDFCILLGNLLENALAACRMKENIQREITLKVGLTAPHIIVISIRNPYIGIIHQQEGVFLSTKHEGEGQGLKSVSLIAEKYDGYMQAEYDDQFFTVKVLLHV